MWRAHEFARFGLNLTIWLRARFLPTLQNLAATPLLPVFLQLDAVMVILSAADAGPSVEKKKKIRRGGGGKKTKAATGAGPDEVEIDVDAENHPSDAEMDDGTANGVSWSSATARLKEGDADDDDDVMLDVAPPSLPAAFPPLAPSALRGTIRSETRRISIPPHRMSPLKKDWVHIFTPLKEMAGLQVRMNVMRKCVELRVWLLHLLRSHY